VAGFLAAHAKTSNERLREEPPTQAN
jgi:hypothetical protein